MRRFLWGSGANGAEARGGGCELRCPRAGEKLHPSAALRAPPPGLKEDQVGGVGKK